MSKALLLITAALIMTTGQAFAEDVGYFNDPAVRGLTKVQPVVIASDMLPVGSILSANVATYANVGTHTYAIESRTRRILRVLQ